MANPPAPAAPAFPLALPTAAEHVRDLGVDGLETVAGRTARQEAARLQAEQAKALETANPAPNWADLQSAKQAEEAGLEAKYGRGETFAAHASRGILDAFLAAPALAGAGLETVGDVTGIDTLKDFGRDVGRASTGRHALGTLAGVFGDEGSFQANYAKEQRDIEDSAKAWPLLSTISRGSGQVAGAILTGGISGGANVTSVGAKAAFGALEGAGAGAQQAYDENAPLQDVLTSTALGAALGGASAGVLAKGEQWVTSGAAREAFGDFAASRVGKAIGLTRPQIAKMGEDTALQLGKDVSSYTLANGEKVFPDDWLGAFTEGKASLAERIAQGKAEIGEKIGDIRRVANDYIEKEAPELRPNATDLIAKMRKDVVDELASDAITRGKVGPLNNVIESLAEKADENGTVSLSALRATQEKLKGIYKDFTPEVLAAKEPLKALERMIDDTVTETVDKVAPKIGGATAEEYGKLKGLYGSFVKADMAAEKALAVSHGNNIFSLTSQMAGLAEFAHASGEGGGAIAGVKGMAVAAAHKYLREQGSTILAAGANKLANLAAPELAETLAPVGISLARAGGREAKTVVDYFLGAQRAIADAAERAGVNPDMRMLAQQHERERQTELLAARAGDYDPQSWAEQAPTPIQKVVYRGPILDQVSRDVSVSVQSAMQHVPDRDLEVDPRRIQRLTRNANGEAAIGRLQQLVQDIINTAPPSVFGDAIQDIAGKARFRLMSTDVPESFMLGHAMASGLRSFAAQARDEVTQQFALRQAGELHDALASDDFGDAGQLYEKAFPDAPKQFAALGDPAAVREALRNTSSRGDLPDIVKDFRQQLTEAHDARSKLTGLRPERAFSEDMRNLEQMATRAEGAVTLDGGPIGRVVDHVQNGPDAEQPSLDTMVLRTVSEQMRHILPALKQSPADERPRPDPRTQRSQAELQQIYQERMGQLTQIASSPDDNDLMRTLQAHPQIPDELKTLVGADAGQRMSQLLSDLPKPAPNVRGKAFETLSSNDLRVANAMWEATMQPMSVFEDFSRGSVDYDKVQYAWKQYPGLQQAAQAATLDLLSGHLDDSERATIPDSILTQTDYLLGFGGRLQGSVEAGFSMRMSAIGAQAQQEAAQPRGQLQTPASKPTYTQRLMGQHG